MTFTLAGVFYAVGGLLAAAQLGLGNAQIGMGRLFTTVTAVVVGGTALSGGQGSVLQTVVGVLIVVVLSNGMVLMGIPPSVQIGVQGLMIIVAVALSMDRQADADRQMSTARPRPCRWSRSTSASPASTR